MKIQSARQIPADLNRYKCLKPVIILLFLSISLIGCGTGDIDLAYPISPSKSPQIITRKPTDLPPPTARDPVRVLFIGNSLTFYNDLPGTFAELALSGGFEVEVGLAAQGGWTLADHAASDQTNNLIAAGIMWSCRNKAGFQPYPYSARRR